jgi:pSer/pThr/pTyr-binding forkhead associated (FHA) protein
VLVRGELPPDTRWRFRGRILRVGASENDNDVVIDLPEISGEHARFELFPSGAVFVTDQESSNGTWVEGRRVPADERVEVKPGQLVALSQQVVVRLEQPGFDG